MFPAELETDRLRMEQLTPETADALSLYEHHRAGAPGIEESTEFVTWDPHETPKETWDFLAEVGEKLEDAEGVVYAIYPRSGEDGAGEYAGNAGINVDWERRTATFGMWLRPRFWGRGYSGERAAAFMRVAFERLDLELVAVAHIVGNDNSRRAIRKYVDRFGGRHEGRLRNWVVVDDEPRDAHRYTVSKAEYRAATGADEDHDG